jgi:hypothetical protein
LLVKTESPPGHSSSQIRRDYSQETMSSLPPAAALLPQQ